MWGVPLEEIQAGEARYAEFGAAPMAGYDTPAAAECYPWWPKPDRFAYDAAVDLARRAAQDYAVIGPWVSCFEIYCQLRGLEQALIDLAENATLVEPTLDRIEARYPPFVQKRHDQIQFAASALWKT